MSDFAPCLAFTLRAEGGFVDDPRDPGGATNMGITLATLTDWRDEDCTADDVRALTRAEAGAIYHVRYWNTVRGDDLPSGVDLMVFDFGVNAGPPRAARMLQAIAQVTQDGAIGGVTLAAVRKLAPAAVVAALAAQQEAYYRGLAQFATYGKGWLNRAHARRDAALALARAHG